jgi:hypothetical protein
VDLGTNELQLKDADAARLLAWRRESRRRSYLFGGIAIAVLVLGALVAKLLWR